jgi:competence protein ComEC
LYGGAKAAEAPSNLRAGDRVEALVRARPPRNYLDPGAFDLRGFLARQNVDLIGSLRSGELLRSVDQPSPTLLQRIARARGDMLTRLDSLFAGQREQRAVLRAMLLGDRGFVDSDVVTAFQKTAAYHVLVVAGLHVGALAAFLYWFCRRLRFSTFQTSMVTVAALAAYVGIVQDRPPILRAALMAALYLCARPLFRRVELLNTVALAGLAILFWKPSSLVDSSFQLSFVAAGVIAGLALPWMDRTSALYRAGLAHLGDVTRDAAHAPKVAQFRIETRAAVQWLTGVLPQRLSARASTLVTLPIRAGLRLWEIVLLSLVIQWGMMPLLALDFHRVSMAGPLSNIPAVILTGFIVPLGFLTLLATFVWGRLAAAIAKILGLCASWLLSTVGWFSRWPRVSYRIPGPPWWLAILFFGVFVCLVADARTAAANQATRAGRRGLPPVIRPAEWIAALALASLTIMVAVYPFDPDLEWGKLEVSVLDVGQGDSIFAAFPDGRTLLMDGGGQPGSEWVGGHRSGVDIGEQVVSPYLWSRGLKRLDVVALTHAHHDHLDGLHSVLENFRVRELWIGRDEETPAFESLLSEARARGVAIVHKKSGEHLNWGGVDGSFLWPPDTAAVPQASNDDSLVLRLADDQMRFLLPGDIQNKVEDELVKEQAPLAADFLKVPHHGSKTSSTELFLTAVAPRVAVISVGEANPFGHPAENIVERYEHSGVRLLRTDRDGAVTALTDGKNMVVHAFAELPPN